MRRKPAIGLTALTVVVMPAALYGFAIVAMWPNSTVEQLFETGDSPMMTRKVLLQRLHAEGYGQQAASFVDVQTEAQFTAKLADIKRRWQASATVWRRWAGASPATIHWRLTGALHEISRSAKSEQLSVIGAWGKTK
jgi:hypothetical protein